MSELKDFFAASVGAAAALVGLLFVAITLSPDKVFGGGVDPAKRAQAVGAFVALTNIFFVSLAALIPDVTARVIIPFALIAAVQIVRESIALARMFPQLRGRRRFGILAFCIYTVELVLAVRFAANATPPKGIVYLVFGLYAYALGACWQLLGANVAAKE